MRATVGRGDAVGDGDQDDIEAAQDSMKPAALFFEPLPRDLASTEEMLDHLHFQHRDRLTPFAKELLELPCMRELSSDGASAVASTCYGAEWRATFIRLMTASSAALMRIARQQDNAWKSATRSMN